MQTAFERERIKKSQRGSVLLIVAAILVVLSTLIETAVVNFDVGLTIFKAINEKKQTFYMSEGVRSLVTVLMQTYLATNASPTSDDLSLYLNDKLPALVPPPFSASHVDVSILNFIPNAILTSGPYQGMNGPITTLSVKFSVSSPSTAVGGNVIQKMDLQISIAYISMFQFLVFYDTGTAFLQTGPDLNVKGRLHSNGDFCVGSDGGYEYLLKVTVGGRLMATNDARCGYVGISNTKIATDGTFTTFADLKNTYDNGCNNCNGTGLNWQAFAIARWHQQALDSANGVTPLVLPGSGMGLVQAAQAGNWAAVNNGSDLRFILDPVLPTDSPSVQSYKFAFNADLRIINGVWYLKDPANAYNWPGLPIWSDHPGRFTENGLDVGQDDIRDLWAPTTNPWPAAPATPKDFSYYEYDSVNQTLFPDNAVGGVISYGNVFNTGIVPVRWRPGNWIKAGASTMCVGGVNVSCGGGACEFRDVWDATQPICAGAAAPERDPGRATQLLNATRGGIRNGHIFQVSPGTAAARAARSKLLPVNFDVAQLQVALADTNPGELGSYFGLGRTKGTAFNGIVYITSVWPGGLNGFGVGGPAEFPYQGAVADANQIGAAHTAIQQALPQPLCSNNPLAPKPGHAGSPFDRQGAANRFKIPDCVDYAAGGAIQDYPNVVRVINGSAMTSASFPKGLSIVSNLPVYMTGDHNKLSTQASGTSVPWVSSLVAGDRVNMISNSWNDANSRWDINPSLVDRLASNTTYNTALITDSLTFFLEDWNGKTMTVNGSEVLGHNQVYSLHDNYCCGNVSYQPPTRVFNFDPHFAYITNQPPGTPTFPVSAVLIWANPE